MRDQLPGKEGILGSRQVPARDDRQGRARRDVVLPLSPSTALRASGVDAVTAAFRQYADRGVFRGFRAVRAGGRVEYQFHWLTRCPMHARVTRHGVLTFSALLPQVSRHPGLALAVTRLVAARSTRGVPAHKRIDARRARLSSSVRRGDFSLAITIRGANHEYAVKQALNLVNELFVFLHEQHPGYLVEHFGISTE